MRGHDDVVDVEQQAAAAPPHQLGEKFRLREGRMAKAQIARRVLDRDLPAQSLLKPPDIANDDVERLLGIGQRQQVVEVAAAVHAPRQMIGDQRRF